MMDCKGERKKEREQARQKNDVYENAEENRNAAMDEMLHSKTEQESDGKKKKKKKRVK